MLRPNLRTLSFTLLLYSQACLLKRPFNLFSLSLTFVYFSYLPCAEPAPTVTFSSPRSSPSNTFLEPKSAFPIAHGEPPRRFY